MHAEAYYKLKSVSIISTHQFVASLSDLETRPHETIDEWFDQVNLQYLQLNRYSAYYMWELSTNPTTKINDEASLFGGIRSRWITRRCNEATSMMPDMTRIQKRMVKILCRGPKYTNYQGRYLEKVLNLENHILEIVNMISSPQ